MSWENDPDYLRAIIAEQTHAIMRLPEPPDAIGDGPDERCGYAAQRIKDLIDAATPFIEAFWMPEERLDDGPDKLIVPDWSSTLARHHVRALRNAIERPRAAITSPKAIAPPKPIP